MLRRIADGYYNLYPEAIFDMIPLIQVLYQRFFILGTYLNLKWKDLPTMGQY